MYIKQVAGMLVFQPHLAMGAGVAIVGMRGVLEEDGIMDGWMDGARMGGMQVRIARCSRGRFVEMVFPLGITELLPDKEANIEKHRHEIAWISWSLINREKIPAIVGYLAHPSKPDKLFADSEDPCIGKNVSSSMSPPTKTPVMSSKWRR